MDKRLLKAAIYGDPVQLAELASEDSSFLLRTTPQGNNCIHISSIHGNEEFIKNVVEFPTYYSDSLLSDANFQGQTPLLIAVTLGHIDLANYLLHHSCNVQELRHAILHQDSEKSNALHHAIRNGHRDFALKLIEAEPSLSQAANNYDESPMFIAVMRDFTDVSERLLQIPDSSHVGTCGRHALHAAARNGNQDIATSIMLQRPQLAREADKNHDTPIRLAICYNKVDVLRVLLGHDVSLGYEVSNKGFTLLTSAATRGHVDVARELLLHCPDAPYRHVHHKELTCLHTAVSNNHSAFVEFILERRQFRHLINMRDGDGKTALHHAIVTCNPRIVHALLSHNDIDTTILDNGGNSAASQLSGITGHDNTLDWTEVHVLMLKADPKDDDLCLYKLHETVKRRATVESRKERKSLTQKYTSNTSLVAILLATITFTAAFTLPGGYSSEPGSPGLLVMSKKVAFQLFLIFDTLAMCSSFVVAIICLMGRWEDERFMAYYISVTKKLAWTAYMATLAAFAAGSPLLELTLAILPDNHNLP
ncbi:ankyrin repeat-containing protein At5g02620-like [Lolium rigidum]|uniref:ankyrin repeat-containing protein At5g02620-like n=1 Tax=Lolium rigidum TaxID=89674 RepID=UPI001F5D5F1C|nr:ankyrin repeat-containing protein At5g02620-like [Lolium rigidum]